MLEVCVLNPPLNQESPRIRVFESRLDKMWKNQLMKFNYKEELCL